jgi:hypothetical protein
MLVFDWPAAIRIKTACTDCIWDFALRLSAIFFLDIAKVSASTSAYKAKRE